MSHRMILNETSYFGAGARAELVGEVKRRGYKKALVVTDAVLVKADLSDARLEGASVVDPPVDVPVDGSTPEHGDAPGGRRRWRPPSGSR